MAVEGPRTKWPVAAMRKKQACVSISTPEAELVAGCYGLRCEGLPAKLFFEETVGKLSAVTWSAGSASATGCNQSNAASLSSAKAHANTGTLPLVLHADNSAMISILRTGKTPTARSIGRTHGISLQWTHDVIKTGEADLNYIPMDVMAADIFTKHFPQAKAATWNQDRKLINVLSLSEMQELGGQAGGRRPVSG